MDSIYLRDSLGNLLTPVWSKKDSVLICSVLVPPVSIAPNILRYSDTVPRLLRSSTPEAVLRDLDFTTSAVWYCDREHWLGWIPTGEPPSSPYETEPILDLLEICFRRGPVPTVDNFYDDYDSDHQISPVERLAGCHLDSAWVEEASYLGDRLHAICLTLAETNEFYCRGPPLNLTGDIPDPIDVRAMEVLFSSDGEAQAVAIQVRRGLLSFLGFLAWMLSLVQLNDTKLSAGDQQYVQQLRLGERPKTGAVFNLTRDQHEINFPHWANNGVPFHYVWTEVEAKNRRLLRFSPEYYEEVARLRELGNGEDKTVEDLPSYPLWKDDLNGSDWIGQNLRAGKMGVVEDRFRPSMRYGIVDRHLYGARPLVNWSTIRVYAERFKALIREGERETVCTFFRNNPVHQDEPAYGRPPLQHKFALTDFAREEAGEVVPEQVRYYKSNTVICEQVKNLYAPRPDRPFNSFNGGPALGLPGGSSGSRRGRSRGQASPDKSARTQESPTRSRSSPSRHRSPGPSTARKDVSRSGPEIRGKWARAVAGLRRRSSRSLSPPRHAEKGKRRQARSLSSVRTQEPDENDDWFQEEYMSAVGSNGGGASDEDERMGGETFATNRDNSPFDSSIDPVGSWVPKYRTPKEALDDLAAWAPSVIEYNPKKPPYDPLSWNSDWLDRAYLVVDDPRTVARLKALSALFPEELDDIRRRAAGRGRGTFFRGPAHPDWEKPLLGMPSNERQSSNDGLMGLEALPKPALWPPECLPTNARDPGLSDNASKEEAITTLCAGFAAVEKEDGSSCFVECVINNIVLEKGCVGGWRSVKWVIWEVIGYLVKCIAWGRKKLAGSVNVTRDVQ
ncbi:hypothetical protein B0H14DRAFT_3148033 [Mycena olivaceomarginata]|nr:hypothetical protein B0H14DRAFT_3148033 [Mycena olivaceomarginata]